MDSARWHSAHIHHHDVTGFDGLLLDAVRPLFAALPPAATGAFFVRHWRRGPHIRVNVKASDAAWAGEIRALVDKFAGGYLSEHPSAGCPSPEREAVIHERLAELEQERGPLSPWCPDNSVQYLPYDRRLHVLGTEEAADLLADFHSDTTPLAFEILDDVRAGRRELLDTGVALMIATAQAICPPITRGFVSYRSHAEGFLANCGDPQGLRARFDQVYARNADGLAELLAEVVAAVDDRSLPLVTAWVDLLRGYRDRVERLYTAGLLPLPDSLPAAVRDEGPPAPGWDTMSDFHQALYGNAEVRRELSSSWFAVYRTLLNYQYLLLSRLGVTPVQRFMLCHLVATTVEATHDLPLGTVIDALRSGSVVL